jgi:hypothetical protein
MTAVADGTLDEAGLAEWVRSWAVANPQFLANRVTWPSEGGGQLIIYLGA